MIIFISSNILFYLDRIIMERNRQYSIDNFTFQYTYHARTLREEKIFQFLFHLLRNRKSETKPETVVIYRQMLDEFRAIWKYLIVYLLLLQFNVIRTNRQIALILARGGSKQLPNKNLATIQGKSLLGRTVAVAIASQVFDEVWVSTDDLTILNEAVFSGAKVHARSEHTASDTATSLEAIIEFLNFFPNSTTVALLQCTSPFLSSIYLRKAYFMMHYSKYDSVFTVTQNSKLLWLKREDGAMIPVNFEIGRRPRRQDKYHEYVENGMIYWFRTELAWKGTLQGGRTGTIEVPSERSIEIDSPVDLTFARLISRELYAIIEWEKDTCIPEDEHG